jgi:hypothetical protein
VQYFPKATAAGMDMLASISWQHSKQKVVITQTDVKQAISLLHVCAP